jgi:hypothetical protein
MNEDPGFEIQPSKNSGKAGTEHAEATVQQQPVQVKETHTKGLATHMDA